MKLKGKSHDLGRFLWCFFVEFLVTVVPTKSDSDVIFCLQSLS